ncbi:TetR/AcrR family transcriptional regulator [Paenibacillus daejeonensis]|uniref:TetR/AcrR family transcriptional regulator n=1 Tax=Paenibacillus daejeonensis TaxID=135193 RepID=UPI000361DC6C|nr:TetR/AcrR family transcriptional regulator [Paenibacillus daejeonensis]
MGRTREFDVERTLHQCMEVFWEKGFQTTCLDDLTETTGVKKQSLYGAFENKRALFLKALSLYREQSISQLEELASDEAPPMEQLQAVGNLVLGYTNENCKGCLIINTALEFGSSDEEVLREVETMYAETERILSTIIVRGQDQQQITRRHTAPELAAHLTNVIRGSQVLAKSGVSADQSGAVLKTAFSLLAP